MEEPVVLGADFYDRFYPAAETSRAHALFCERVYGKNLCQHGMADMEQLELLLGLMELPAHGRLLDVGCGSGHITQYLQGRTGCRATGVDLSPAAIALARGRTAGRPGLRFDEGDMTRLEYAGASFDAVTLIDTHYFAPDTAALLDGMLRVTAPGGKVFLFSDEGRGAADLDDSALRAEESLIGQALANKGVPYRAVSLSRENAAHWKRKEAALRELREAFEAEGNLFLWEQRMGECEGMDHGRECRFLFILNKDAPAQRARERKGKG